MAQYHTCSQIWHTHLSEDTVLCLRPSHSAVMPSVVKVPPPFSLTPQSWLPSKLPATDNERFQKCDRAALSYMLAKVTVGCQDPKQSGREINTVGVPRVEGQQWARFYLSCTTDAARGSRRLRSFAPIGPTKQSLRSSSPMASSLRSRCTGTLRISPEAAHAIAMR
jgi:hypothetical protein